MLQEETSATSLPSVRPSVPPPILATPLGTPPGRSARLEDPIRMITCTRTAAAAAENDRHASGDAARGHVSASSPFARTSVQPSGTTTPLGTPLGTPPERNMQG